MEKGEIETSKETGRIIAISAGDKKIDLPERIQKRMLAFFMKTSIPRKSGKR